jgi:hypothetical protein
MDEHIALLKCFRKPSHGSFIIYNKIILRLPSTEKEFLATHMSIWTKYSVPSVWGGIMVVRGEDGNTAFYRVTFHPNSYKLIITRPLPLGLHRLLRNLHYLAVYSQRTSLLFHLGTWRVELRLSTPSASEKHNICPRLSPIFDGTFSRLHDSLLLYKDQGFS